MNVMDIMEKYYKEPGAILLNDGNVGMVIQIYWDEKALGVQVPNECDIRTVKKFRLVNGALCEYKQSKNPMSFGGMCRGDEQPTTKIKESKFCQKCHRIITYYRDEQDEPKYEFCPECKGVKTVELKEE